MIADENDSRRKESKELRLLRLPRLLLMFAAGSRIRFGLRRFVTGRWGGDRLVRRVGRRLGRPSIARVATHKNNTRSQKPEKAGATTLGEKPASPIHRHEVPSIRLGTGPEHEIKPVETTGKTRESLIWVGDQ
jgi:hypothetical protein